MKLLISLILCITVLFGLTACSRDTSAGGGTVTFYYLRSNISAYTDYGDANSVIVAEAQPALEYSNTLGYLLALYLNGPSDSRLYSPFPSDLRIRSIEQTDSTIRIDCNEALARLKGIKLTKACACLALTCFSLTDAETVSIQANTELLDNLQSIDLTRDDLILEDLPVSGGQK